MSVLIDNEILHSKIERFIYDNLDKSPAAGLSPLHMYILNELYTADCRKASDLARQVGRAATSFTPILDQLEIIGMICRQMHPTDRRAVNICLTEKGKGVKATIQKIIGKVEVEFGNK